MAKREVFKTTGLLSQAVRYGDLVYSAGITGRDPETGEMPPDIVAQSHNTLKNIQAALQAAGTSLEHALYVTVYFADINDRPAFNSVYRQYFPKDPPGRAGIEVGRLGEGAKVEVQVVAGMPG